MAKFCVNCGAELNDEQDVCLKCGVRVKNGKMANDNYSDKSKITAALLAFFIGYFGVHNFYLGYNGKAITQLLLSVLGIVFSATIIGLVVGIPMIMVSSTWAFIESILLFTGNINSDANGNILKS